MRWSPACWPATDGERPAVIRDRAPGGDVREVRGLPHRGAPDRGPRRGRIAARARASTCGSTTVAAATTPTWPMRSSSASCSTAPRRPSTRRWPAPRVRGGHAREDFPERDDDELAASTPSRPARRRAGEIAPELQAGDDHEVRAEAEGVLTDGRHAPHPPLQPGGRRRAALGGVRRRGRADRPGARPPAPGEVVPGRDAHLPSLVRPRGVRLRRDAHQRTQPAGLRVPRPRRRHATITVEPIRGMAIVKDLLVDMEPFWESYRRSCRTSSTTRSRPTARSVASRRPTASATRTRAAASCAPPAPRAARCSGPTRRTSARRPS